MIFLQHYFFVSICNVVFSLALFFSLSSFSSRYPRFAFGICAIDAFFRVRLVDGFCATPLVTFKCIYRKLYSAY